jgi:stress response protein YsnF
MEEVDMSQKIVIDSTGAQGLLVFSGEADEGVAVGLADGTSLDLQSSELFLEPDGSYRYAGRFEDRTVSGTDGPEHVEASRIVIPVIEESLEVSKRTRVTGRVRIYKTESESIESVDLSLVQQTADIEHVTMNQHVHEVPFVRYEGETMIIPVVEEVLVVEKRLILKEEVRITPRRQEVSHHVDVTLRSDTVHIERVSVSDIQER